MRKVSTLSWFLRTTLVLLTTCLGVVALIIILGRLANPNPACLNIESYQTDILDPTIGKTLTISQPNQGDATPIPPRQDMASGYSSNGKRLAYFIDYSQSGLRVEKIANPPLTHKRYYRSYVNNPFLDEIQWSPDDQWIAYRWKGSDHKQYLAIADADGNERNITTLDSLANEETQLGSWSADSKYIAILNQNGGSGNGRIRFLSIPDLKIFDPGDLGQRLGTGCVGQSEDSLLYCQPWAGQGHAAAYVIDQDTITGNLVMLNLDTLAEKVFPLPIAQSRTVRNSPDGHSTAIGSYTWTGGPTLSLDGELDVYNIDGTVFHNVSNVAFAGLANADGPISAEITLVTGRQFLCVCAPFARCRG